MKTIRGKIQFNVIGGMLLLAVLIGVVSSWFSFQSAMLTAEKTLRESVRAVSGQITAQLQALITLTYETGSLAALSDPTNTLANKQAIINQKIETYHLFDGDITDTQGKSLFSGADVSGEMFFKQALAGQGCIGDPTVSSTGEPTTLTFAAPLWEKGIPGSTAVGIVYFYVDNKLIHNIVNTMRIGETGTTYILDKMGTTIAHPNAEIVKNQENSQTLLAGDPALASLAAVEREMIAGKSGYHEYKYRKISKFLAYMPVSGTNGWSVGLSVGKREILQSTNMGVFCTLGISAALLILCSIFSGRIVKRIVRPIVLCIDRLDLLSQGDLHTPLPEIYSTDETGKLADSVKTTVENLCSYVDTIGDTMSSIAKGNLAVKKPENVCFAGDFLRLETSIDAIVISLNDCFKQMKESAELVGGGAKQVASGAQLLAHGSSEQADSVDQLACSITEITAHIKQNAENAFYANQAADTERHEIQHGNEQMDKMNAAMSEMRTASGEISKVIKVIEDIAFQTNILALNAAVEAARAGNAGKGFAVVADEVRNLAGKSAQAAKSTTALIESAVHAVEKGSSIVSDTSASFYRITDESGRVISMVEQISLSSGEQAAAAKLVANGVQQISGVVQQNSATAQQSAAAAEELSSQADMLRSLLRQFKLNENARV